MKAVVTGEGNGVVGVNLRDNGGVEHLIEMTHGGEITGHQQDGYPDDPDDRTEAGNEHVNQARRFARYWVYRKRGYDTLEPTKNPDQIAQAAVALTPLSADVANSFFGELYHHLRSIYTDAESSIRMPEGVTPEEAVYQQDIYLGMDSETASAYADILTDPHVVDLLEDEVAGATIDELDAEAIADAAGVDLESMPNIRDGALVEAVSGVHVHWDDALGQYHTQWGTQPDLEREPDARIEIFAYEPDSFVDLKTQLVRNLVCQVRDCYLAMGIAPPEQFRILGHGRHDASTWYSHYDFYDEYFDPDAEISTWYEEQTPENAYEHEGETRRVHPNA
ncbi:hypothetical protein [Natrarchaeobaculum aegyptiacum]|uniref:Uncharacterized protein n=1 Tax=Natrarchaeobaculum aegyptiacum TaxID=745377 RepID=A0A2Z2I238_9EURY|nr:hypothetical protein [Natrarchaeobaculum aegyptiacum]ARS90728.1 hypothetical protein B1756_13980 [Natrarchaeobaculum aegyptiacum]